MTRRRRPRLMVISGGVSAVTEAPQRPATDETASTAGTPDGFARGQAVITVGLAAALVAIAFVTGGGVDETVASPGNTWTEIVLTALGAVGVAVGVFRRPAGTRRHGWLALGLMGLMFALEAASIAWSVVPDSSWLAAGQMLAYLAVFAGAIALTPSVRGRWAALIGALTLWATALAGWSLLSKVFPATLLPGHEVGRLQGPFGYWNAIALCAAMGVPGCLWLGGRRDGGRRLAGLAVPALSLLVAVLVLSSSRSADLAAAVAIAVWLVLVPLRLRGVVVLALGIVGGAAISVWALVHHAISADGVAMRTQDHAGHIFGIVILVVLVLVTIAGVGATDAMNRTVLDPQARRRLGNGLGALVVVGVVAVVGAVALSHRGLTGEISYRWHELVNPNGSAVSASSAGRVLQFGSSRPSYWHEALAVGDHNVLKGVGELGFSAARTRYTTDPTVVQQAHGYVFETYADLGILGVLVTAGLLAAWLSATGRTLGWGRPERDPALSAERIGFCTLLASVLAFGVQGTLDWTWYFTGLAVPALLAAGWLAARGPLRATADAGATSPRTGSILDRPGVLALSVLLCAAVLAGGWLTWRPLRAAQLVNASSPSLASARAAQSADPFSLQAAFLLSQLYLDLHRPAQAQAVLVSAAHQQPDNPLIWSQLAEFAISRRSWHEAAGYLDQVRALDRTADPLGVLTGQQSGVVFKHLQHP